MHDVIVCDEEFEQAASTVSDVCSQLEDLLRGYLFVMDQVTKVGAMSGKTGEAMKDYVSAAKELKGLLPLLAEHNSLICRDFVRDIDEADRYLF